MKIEVRVFATLRRYIPELGVGEAKIVELSEGITFETLRKQLGLPLEEIKIIMRNGIQTEMDEIIEDGDRIAYVPAVGEGNQDGYFPENPLWGFELTYPDDWVQQSRADADGFAQDVDAFDQVGSVNEQAAHMLVRGEFNGKRAPIAPLWNQHITKLSIMLGAKKLGASPFSMGGANGFEAEIQLPKKVNRRLWAGILARETVILHFMVAHKKTERDAFEPKATQIISSLRFLERVEGVATSTHHLPFPPNYAPVDSTTLIPDAQNDENWEAFDGNNDIGALQNFYYRELPKHGWEISEFIPFPNQVNVDFARLRIRRESLTATLGILPTDEKKPLGKIVVKYE